MMLVYDHVSKCMGRNKLLVCCNSLLFFFFHRGIYRNFLLVILFKPSILVVCDKNGDNDDVCSREIIRNY